MILEFITKNWLLKLTSLILAIGLWNYALGEEGIQVTRNIPLEIQVENSQISLLKQSTNTIKVVLSAPRALLSDIASGEIYAVHKVGDDVKSAGDYSFRLEEREIKVPDTRIQVVKMEPDVIRLTLDELIVQKFAVKPNFAGEPAFGYTVNEKEIQLDPNALLIEGPKGQIEKLDFLLTEPLDLVGRIRSFRRTVSLELPPNTKPLGDALIDAYIPIKEEFEEKGFESIEVKVLRSSSIDESVSIIPERISFVLKGSVQQLEKFATGKILAYVDITGLNPGEYESAVEIILPEGVALVSEGELKVKVSIQKR